MALVPIGGDVDKLYKKLEKDVETKAVLAKGVAGDLLVRIRFSQDYELLQLQELEAYLNTQEDV